MEREFRFHTIVKRYALYVLELNILRSILSDMRNEM